MGSAGTGVFDPKWDAAVRDFYSFYSLTPAGSMWPRNCTTEVQRQANCSTDFAAQIEPGHTAASYTVRHKALSLPDNY